MVTEAFSWALSLPWLPSCGCGTVGFGASEGKSFTHFQLSLSSDSLLLCGWGSHCGSCPLLAPSNHHPMFSIHAPADFQVSN